LAGRHTVDSQSLGPSEPLFDPKADKLPQLGPLHGNTSINPITAKRVVVESIGLDSSPSAGSSFSDWAMRCRRDSDARSEGHGSVVSMDTGGGSARSPGLKRSRSPAGGSISTAEPKAESKVENKPTKPELTLANIQAYIALYGEEEQLTTLPMKEYMSKQQPSVTPSMRLILFNWLVEVHQHRRMNPETLHMTFSLVDRFLSLVPVTRGTLQLVGSVAWMLASKFEEVCAPSVSQVVEMAAGAYSAQQVLDMERLMLHVLCFRLNVESQYHHQLRARNACGLGAKAESLAMCLAELAALDYGMLPFAGATLAAASTALALVCYTGCDWRDACAAVARISGDGCTNAALLVECARRLRLLFGGAATADYNSVFEKYSRTEYHCVAHAVLGPL
jgi:hypothetical protein